MCSGSSKGQKNVMQSVIRSHLFESIHGLKSLDHGSVWILVRADRKAGVGLGRCC